MVTRRSPCFTRKSEIISAGDDSAGADPQKSRTIESRMAKCGFMYFRARGTNRLGSTYHSFPHYDNARKELENADRERVEHLFTLYEKLTSPILAAASVKTGREESEEAVSERVDHGFSDKSSVFCENVVDDLLSYRLLRRKE